jgi:hypothetical protein
MTCAGRHDRSSSHAFSTSASSPESSGSEYNPFSVRKSRKKKAQHKGKSGNIVKSKGKTSKFHGYDDDVSVALVYHLCAKWS